MSEEKDGAFWLPNDEGQTFRLNSIPPEKQSVIFNVGGKEFIRLVGNGDIFVRGQLVENDKLLVQGLREWLSGVRKETGR